MSDHFELELSDALSPEEIEAKAGAIARSARKSRKAIHIISGQTGQGITDLLRTAIAPIHEQRAQEALEARPDHVPGKPEVWRP